MPNDGCDRRLSKLCIALLLMAAVAGCKSQSPPPAQTSTSMPASRPGEISVAEAISILTGHPSAWANMSGSETQVELRMMLLASEGRTYNVPEEPRQYKPAPEDLPQLLQAFHDPQYDVPAKLCISHLLVQLNNQEGRDYIASCARRNNCEVAANTIHILLLDYPNDAAWRKQQVLALLDADKLMLPEWTIDQARVKLKDKAAVAEVVAQQEEKGFGGGIHTLREFCEFLVNTECREAAPILARLVKNHPDSDDLVKTLAKLDPAAAEPVFLETLFKDDRFVYRYTAPPLNREVWGTASSSSASEPDTTPPEQEFKVWEMVHEMSPSKKELRYTQLRELVQLRSEKLLPILRTNLDLDWAIEALVEIQGAKATDALKAYIKNREAPFYFTAATHLAKLAAKDKQELASQLLDLLKQAPVEDNICVVVVALGDCRDARAVEPLLEIARTSKSHSLSRTTISALGKTGDKRAVSPLVELAKGDLDLRGEVISTLGDIGDQGSVKDILDLVNLDTKNTPYDYEKALVKLGGPLAIDHLAKIALTTQSTFALRNSIEGLGRIGGPDAAAALISLFDRDWSKAPSGFKGLHADWPKVICSELKEITGESFDTPQAWREWQHKQSASVPAE